MDTLHRARLYRLFDLVFRGPFLGNNLRLIRLFIEFKDLRADLLAGATPCAELRIDLCCHVLLSLEPSRASGQMLPFSYPSRLARTLENAPSRPSCCEADALLKTP